MNVGVHAEQSKAGCGRRLILDFETPVGCERPFVECFDVAVLPAHEVIVHRVGVGVGILASDIDDLSSAVTVKVVDLLTGIKDGDRPPG
jgi:hypothetical protein